MAEYIIDVPYKLERVDANEVDAELKLVGFPVREEIIRCRDCIYWTDEDFCNNSQWHLDHKFLRPCTEPEGFCAWAERDLGGDE